MKKRGTGIACIYFGMGNTGKPNPSGAFVEVLEDGSAVVLCGAADVGQGSSTLLAQIAAQELGLPVRRITVTAADTQVTPEAGVSSASRQTYISGNAVRLAAAEAKAILLWEAAGISFLGENVANLDCRDGYIFALDEPAKRVPLEKVAASLRARGELVLGHGCFNPSTKALDEETGQGIPYATYGYAAQAAEVEVDTETGEVTVLQVVAGEDVGKAINPQSIEGQIQGAVAMGVGYALMEEVVVREGKVLTPSFAEYLIPTALDVPPVEPIIVENAEPTGPYGAKGTGEPPTCPTAAAIANAIYQATGVRLKKLPLTSENVYQALLAASEEKAGAQCGEASGK